MNQLHALPAVSVDEAALAAADGALLLDVREYEEWMSGHAPTARPHPDERPPLPSRRARPAPAHRLHLPIGNRSSRVTAWLLQQGFDAVNMTGGMYPVGQLRPPDGRTTPAIPAS